MFSGDRVKQYVELGATQKEGYKAEDRPVFGEVGHGPWCAGLPNTHTTFPPGVKLKDGPNGSLDKSATSLLLDPSRLQDNLGISTSTLSWHGCRSPHTAHAAPPADHHLTPNHLPAP